MSIVAAIGSILYGAGTRLFSINPLLPYLVAIITVPLYRKQFRYRNSKGMQKAAQVRME